VVVGVVAVASLAFGVLALSAAAKVLHGCDVVERPSLLGLHTRCPGEDLVRVDFDTPGTHNLSFADLSRANLSEARLRLILLEHANLSDARLTQADLREATCSVPTWPTPSCTAPTWPAPSCTAPT
jgi:uncharacterized protein YjbI with pentapeptide repeats